MLRRILALAAFLVFMVPSGARAQTVLTFSQVEIDLWPEYDQPNMLVIEHLTLPAQTSLPADITVRIPAAAGEPHAVAAGQPGLPLMNLSYDRTTNGDWSQLTFKATAPEIRIEYYDPSLVKNGDARSFDYHWPGDYAVDSLAIQVQQPVEATDLRISPSLGAGVPADNGLVYYTAEVGSLTAGQTFTISLNYKKPSDELTITSQKVESTAPINQSTAGRATPLLSVLPWFLGGLGLLLIVGGGLWYWQSGRARSRPEQRPRHKPSGQREAATAASAETGYVYCHQCGKRASPGDRFCRTCGAQLRST